ncbi:hypothetical protein CZ787_00310 [Halomonas citrativorans]|uniref:Uncharacterized protein n=1 Tax=Halomonas citrativorans TaxID=2742612 RepID=A0A1R4HN03_9GAMM|nr:hypothetical protein CZ787_00310 [Halomonas citrativorans]
MTPTYTRRWLLKIATFTGMSLVLVPVTALLPVANATNVSPTLVNGWLLRASDC